MSHLADLTATQMASAVRAKEVSPVELVDAVLQRINDRTPFGRPCLCTIFFTCLHEMAGWLAATVAKTAKLSAPFLMTQQVMQAQPNLLLWRRQRDRQLSLPTYSCHGNAS